jgi:excisionase family DNA binding protein
MQPGSPTSTPSVSMTTAVHLLKPRPSRGISVSARNRSSDDLDLADLPTRLERMTEALTAPVLAKLLGIGRTVMYEMAAQARIPHFRIGTMIRFDPVQVARWLREREIGSTALAA